MKRPLRGWLLAAAAALLPTAALADSGTKSQRRAISVSILPGKIHEECLRLEEREKRKYHWKASAPVDFNIHFHRGPEVFYPVKREAMRGDGGTFTARTGEDYCWMWTAKDREAKVEGSIE